MSISLRALSVATVIAFGSLSAGAIAQDNPMVGGAAMFADKNIVENAVNSADHTTLVAAVQAAGLVEDPAGRRPLHRAGSVNAAFDALPEGTVETLLKPENKDMLTQILTCHVIPAKALSTDIVSMVEADGGEHVVDTVGGCKLTLKAMDGKVTVTGRERHHGQCHHRGRDPVQWRHPRHRRGSHPQDVTAPASAANGTQR